MSRSKKKGFIYLLKSDKNIFKYGCTSVSIESRIISANSKGYGNFRLLAFFDSDDIFKDESRLKWSYWDRCLAPEEFFISENMEEPLSIFEKHGALL